MRDDFVNYFNEHQIINLLPLKRKKLSNQVEFEHICSTLKL